MDLEDIFSLDSSNGWDPETYQYFNQLLNHRTVVFNTEISDNIVERVYLPLKDFEEDDSDEEITLILNSMGGSVSDGFFLAYYIANYKKPLKIIVAGCAASMAAIILCGGGNNPNVTRICFPSSYVLFHDGYVTLATSEAKTANDFLAFNDRVDQQIRQFVLEHSKITAEQYDAQTRHQWFITAKEMKEFNLIDKIVGCDE